ncbi:hypothetical protein J7413_02615 [Shimia sp. R10_1]|uniref:hypothetical protein n=1 Tax=Shimia sp. R10_1 TaxID=2821095 RepID=UPI001ADB7942|nr:hypothetical protein [Shimia sp. R10_1]MBO9472419.1 hypothetical protein [Shimia sp. R10_1]
MKLTTAIIASTLLCPLSALAQNAPLACEGINGNIFLGIAGPSAQIWGRDDTRIQGVAVQMDQEHEGFPAAWALSITGTQATLVVQEASCSSSGGDFPLSFVMLTNEQLTHGCCTIAE